MGQKVNARGFRLGAQPRTETIRQAEQNQDRDLIKDKKGRNSQTYSYDSFNRSGSGKNLNLIKLLEQIISERRSLQKQVRGRFLVVQKGKNLFVSVEMFDPKLVREDSGQQKDPESISLEDMKVTREVDRQQVVSEYSDLKLQVERISLNEKILISVETASVIKNIRTKLGQSKIKPLRIHQCGRIGAILLNARGPYPKLLAFILAMRREDSRKQSDVLVEVEKVMDLVNESKIGLVTYDQRKSGKKSGVDGGYRGYRFVVKGTIDGSRRTRKQIVQAGTMPFSSISQVISHGDTVAKTKSGTRGVHVNFHY